MPTDFAMTDALWLVLIARRTAAGLTQRELARKVGEPAAHVRVSRYESDQVCGDLDRMVALYAEGIGVSPADLWREALEVAEGDPGGKRAAIARAARRPRR